MLPGVPGQHGVLPDHRFLLLPHEAEKRLLSRFKGFPDTRSPWKSVF